MLGCTTTNAFSVTVFVMLWSIITLRPSYLIVRGLQELRSLAQWQDFSTKRLCLCKVVSVSGFCHSPLYMRALPCMCAYAHTSAVEWQKPHFLLFIAASSIIIFSYDCVPVRWIAYCLPYISLSTVSFCQPSRLFLNKGGKLSSKYKREVESIHILRFPLVFCDEKS